MPDLEQLPLFDYASLDRSTSEFLRTRAAEVKALMRQTVENVIRTGNILIEVKNRLPHGQWNLWCETEFGWTPRTALRMTQVAEKFGTESLADLDIAATALYILSAPSTPQEARDEALFLARKGLPITSAAATELREQHLNKTEDKKPKEKLQSDKSQSKSQRFLELETHPDPQPLITPPPAEFQPLETTQQTIDKPTEATKSDTKAKTGKRERIKKDAAQPSPTLIIDKSLITSKAKTVEEGQTWRLGGFHIIFCGEPTDQRFTKRLPRQTPLLIEFPITRTLLPESFTASFASYFAFFTELKNDFDLNIIRESLEITMEGTTDGGDAVVLYRLPDPAIFLLIDQLECIGYCAEPDPDKCNAAIAAWTTVTKRAASRV